MQVRDLLAKSGVLHALNDDSSDRSGRRTARNPNHNILPQCQSETHQPPRKFIHVTR